RVLRTSRSRPVASSDASSGIGRPDVALEDQAEALEREPRVDLIDELTVGAPLRGEASGGDDRGAAPELLADALDHPVGLRSGPEEQAGRGRRRGVPADARSRRLQL